MKRILKKVIAMALSISMLASLGAIGASAKLETECAGECEYSPVIVLPGINHSPTYLYDENETKEQYAERLKRE